MNDLTKWMTKADTKQKAALAKKAKTSVPYLRQLSSGHRKCGLELAYRIANASVGHKDLPVIRAVSLNKQWKAMS